MKASICLATYDKPKALARVLESIAKQEPPFECEIIVVDDGSPTDATAELCLRYSQVIYVRRWKQPGYTNPARPRNMAYRRALGEVIICQSDDVVHARPDTIERLVAELMPGRFVVGRVLNTDWNYSPTPCLHPRAPRLIEFTGPRNQRPLLFLGAVWREDLYAVGGCEERFTAPGRDDVYFADCLIRGRGVKPHYSQTALGWHLHHGRPLVADCRPSEELYRKLTAERRWCASSGPWPLE